MRTAAILLALVLIGTAINTDAFAQEIVVEELEVYWMSPYVRDMQGSDLSIILIGQPVEVHNTRADSRSGVAIYEIRDQDGFTVYLGWQGVTVGPNGSSVVSQSWLPPQAGEYLFRTFALSAIEGDDTRSLTLIHEAPSLVVLSLATSEPSTAPEDATKSFIIG